MVAGSIPIEEADNAGELPAGCVPHSGLDPQPTGDAVNFPFHQGGAVRRHAILDSDPVDLPGHTDVVWVETRGHAHEGLLVFLVFLVLTLVWRRLEYVHSW